MKTSIVLSAAIALLLTAYIPLAYSWVVFDSRNDMIAMSSETDDVAVRVPAPGDSSSSEEVKKDKKELTDVKTAGGADDENKSETEEAESDEQKEPKFKETKAPEQPAMNETETEDDEATEPALDENVIAEDDISKGLANETTTENANLK